MSLGSDLTAAVAAAQADQAKLHAIVNGPATGVTSLVTLADGVTQVKTLARVVAEAQAFGAIATPAITGGHIPIDLSAAGNHVVTFNADVSDVIVSNPVAGVGNSFTLRLVGNGTAHAFATTTITWLNGLPAPGTGNGKKNDYEVFSLDGGASWQGLILAENY